MPRVEIKPVVGIPVAWFGNRSANIRELTSRVIELEMALREIYDIGSAEVGDVHELWLITGNMAGEAKRVLDGVPLQEET